METDLNLTPDEYYLVIALFQVGYVLAEVPSNMILSISRPSYYIPTLMVLWGIVATCLGAVQNTAQLIGLRVLLGVFEAGFSPAVLFLISTWYRPEEQSKRFITFLSAAIMSGAFGSIVSGAVSGLTTMIKFSLTSLDYIWNGRSSWYSWLAMAFHYRGCCYCCRRSSCTLLFARLSVNQQEADRGRATPRV